MNKRELIGEVARRTGYAEEVCTRVLDTFEEELGDAVATPPTPSVATPPRRST